MYLYFGQISLHLIYNIEIQICSTPHPSPLLPIWIIGSLGRKNDHGSEIIIEIIVQGTLFSRFFLFFVWVSATSLHNYRDNIFLHSEMYLGHMLYLSEKQF